MATAATAAAFLTNAGPAWDAEVYDALSLASRLANAVENRTNGLRLAVGLHKINSRLNELSKTIQRDVEAAEGGQGKVDEEITPQRLHEVAADVDHLARMLESLHESAGRARLTNNSFMAGSLRGIFEHIEELHDLADWFETAAQMTEVNAIFSRAKQERERGDVYDLSQVD